MELADEVGKSPEGGSRWCRRESAGRDEDPDLATTAQAPKSRRQRRAGRNKSTKRCQAPLGTFTL